MTAVFKTASLSGADDFIVPSVPTAYNVNLGQFSLDFYINPRPHTDKLYVFSPGYMNRSTFTLPFFQRLRWLEQLDCTGVILSDPTLNLDSRLGITWFQGTHDRYYAPEVLSFLDRLRDALGVAPSRVLFFGSSAGGFSSLFFAGLMKGSCAVVNNPQTNILRFQEAPVRTLLDLNFNKISLQDAYKRYLIRFDVAEFYKSISYIPNIIYVQNKDDRDHYDNHLIPFLNDLRGTATSSTNDIMVSLYNDPNQKHNPAVFNFIKRYFSMAERMFFR